MAHPRAAPPCGKEPALGAPALVQRSVRVGSPGAAYPSPCVRFQRSQEVGGLGEDFVGAGWSVGLQHSIDKLPRWGLGGTWW